MIQSPLQVNNKYLKPLTVNLYVFLSFWDIVATLQES